MGAHDNRLVGYTVDGRRRRIVLHTEDVHGHNPPSRLDAVFENVELYQFPCANLVSIILDIRERPLRQALTERSAELDQAYRRCGWPERWGDSHVRELEARGLHFFQLESAVGFEGWVVAERFAYADASASTLAIPGAE